MVKKLRPDSLSALLTLSVSQGDRQNAHILDNFTAKSGSFYGILKCD